jgi:integrase
MKRFTKLTRSAIRALTPGKAITEHGITAERLPNGDTRYGVNIMVDGRRVHRVIGRESDGTTRTQAEDYIAKARTEAREDRLHLPRGRKLPMSLAEAAADYIKRLEATDGRNIKIKRRHPRMYLLPFFGTSRLDAIVDFSVQRYIKQRREQTAAAATINRELATIRHLLGRAVEWGWLPAAPRIRDLPVAEGRIVALTDEEVERLRAAALAGPDVDLWLFVEYGLATGMRHMEILRTRWEDLDLANHRQRIPHAKAGPRWQPITGTLAKILAREHEMRGNPETGWIFPARRSDSRAGHLNRRDRPFRQAVVSAGLDPRLVTVHTLRHSVLTKLAQANVDLPTIMRISGHRAPKMLFRYIHPHDRHVADAISVLSRPTPQSAGTITQELHTPVRRAVSGGRKRRTQTAT